MLCVDLQYELLRLGSRLLRRVGGARQPEEGVQRSHEAPAERSPQELAGTMCRIASLLGYSPVASLKMPELGLTKLWCAWHTGTGRLPLAHALLGELGGPARLVCLHGG